MVKAQVRHVVAEAEMNEVIYLALFCIVITLLGIFVRLRWLRVACMVVLFTTASGLLSMGMSGLRAHVEEVREQGASGEFIHGMIERNNRLFPRRVEVFFSVAGLFALGLAASATRKPK